MDIECKLQRKGGTQVLIETTNYHFAPREDGAHVAAVENEAHEARFLSIPEAYRVYRGAAAAEPVAPTAALASAPAPAAVTSETPAMVDGNHIETLYGSAEHPASFEIHGTTYSLGDIVALAHADSGLDVKEWNELEAASRADLIDEQLDKLDEQGPIQANASQKPEPAPTAEDKATVRADLVAQYEAKFGKKPHYNAGIAKLRADLAAE